MGLSRRIFMKSKITIVVFIGLIFLGLFPMISWHVTPITELDVLIINKTVPDFTYREHKGLIWGLNYFKVQKSDGTDYNLETDYVGFVPKENQKYEIRDIVSSLNRGYDLIYMADTYGVYEEEFYQDKILGERSELIYGGITVEEIAAIRERIFKDRIPFVAEFNSFGSPTSKEAQQNLTELLGISWSGWIGRFFQELDPKVTDEITPWMIANYESQYNAPWDFKGEGYVFVKEDDTIMVLVQGKDVGKKGMNFSFTEEGVKHFGTKGSAKYNYWFDVINVEAGQVLAMYNLDLTDEGKEKLESFGLPYVFPAVTRSQYFGTPAYYFAGDFADMGETPRFSRYKGLHKLTNAFTFLQRDTGQKFYNKVYIPMLESILAEAKDIKNSEVFDVEVFEKDNIFSKVTISGNRFQVYVDGSWEDMLIKGVNMGMAKPGAWPGEGAISFGEYYRWMQQIGQMGANTIRVYTIHPPEFYKALWLYNRHADDPLYVFHGIWIEEEGLEETLDAFHEKNVVPFENEMRDVINVIHGNASIEFRPGHAYGEYTYDVSPYVLGWIIGIEWYPLTVEGTNEKHKNLPEFQGNYLYTEDSEAFEKWLAQRLDFLITYEMENYNWQRPISFTNWPTTDLLEHPSEPLMEEDLVGVDPNKIKVKDNFRAGYFASYHVYPYYPEFMNYEQRYLDFIDHRGEKNNYAGYLRDLIDAHEIPVLIAEFGVPSSRGLTHENSFGWNQGGHTEKSQGEIGTHLFDDIVHQGALGGLLFTWQDEWFKRTWNTMDLDNPDGRPYWSNVQTNEQRFGLLSFDRHKMLIDGKKDKWEGITPIYEGNGALKALYMDYDETYLYYRVEYNEGSKQKAMGEMDTFILLDTIQNQGNTTTPFFNSKLNQGIDFVIQISAQKGNSRVWIDQYYDSFYYQNGFLQGYLNQRTRLQKNTGVFNPIRLVLTRPMTIPSTGENIPFTYYETGLLKRVGDNNDNLYDSMFDYMVDYEQGVVEIRIPWLLLNVKDPSDKEIMGDIWQSGIKSFMSIGGIHVGVVVGDNGSITDSFPKDITEDKMATFSWDNWEVPQYKERLKDSYFIFQDYFKNLD